MTTNPRGYMHHYVQVRRNRLLHYFDRKCGCCGNTKSLQFSHKCPTALKGTGRGSQARVKDIETHKDKYLLLCKKCHYTYDFHMCVEDRNDY